MGRQTGGKTLAELGLATSGAGAVEVTGLAVDSREVKPGYLFAAMPGTKMHGAEFIEYCAEDGGGRRAHRPGGRADRRRRDHGLECRSRRRRGPPPGARLRRGTLVRGPARDDGRGDRDERERPPSRPSPASSGKCWGCRRSILGTTGVEGAVSRPLAHTTPEPITLHRVLAELAREGVTHAAMEASSHGLAQKRLDGVGLKAAAFTNITQDHLDYHADFEDYFRAKAALFDRVLSEDGTAVVNNGRPATGRAWRRSRKRGGRTF